MKHKQLFKVVILGDSGVGKTSLMNQFVNKQFTMSYKATVGADFMSKQVALDQTTVTLQIWDTAGQERFQSLGGSFYKGSDCCVIVFDVTDQNSFKSIQRWRNLFFTHCIVRNKEDYPIVILGNKADLKQRRVVSEEAARQWQQKGLHIAYHDTSAKDTLNVEKAFQSVARLALNNALLEPKLIPQSVVLHKKSASKKSGCC